MTIKQMNRANFWRNLEAYKISLKTKSNIVGASLAVHASLGCDGVPKSWKRYVTATFKGI